MEFSAEQKARIEVPLKESLKKLGEAMIEVQKAVVENSANKIDDVIEPVVRPMAVEGLNKLIDSLKL